MTRPTAFKAVAKLSLAYFSVVFAAGFVLGVVRTLWLVRFVGERAAELIEMPFMLYVSFVTARFLVDRWRATLSASSALAGGGVALLLLLGVELTVVLSARGLTITEYVATRDPLSGTVYALSLLAFMLMPATCLLVSQQRPC